MNKTVARRERARGTRSGRYSHHRALQFLPAQRSLPGIVFGRDLLPRAPDTADWRVGLTTSVAVAN